MANMTKKGSEAKTLRKKSAKPNIGFINVNHNKDCVLERVSELEWKHWLNRPYNPFWATFVWTGIAERYFKIAGFEYFADGANLYQYPDMFYSTLYEKKSDQWAKKFFANNRVLKLTQMIERTHKKNMAVLNKQLNSNDDIEIRIDKFFEACRLYIPYLWLVLPIENYFNGQIEKQFKKHYPDDYKKIAADLSVPTKKTVYEKMLAELDSGTPLNEIRDRLGWLKSRDGFSPFYSVNDLREIKKNHQKPKAEKCNVKPPKSLVKLIEDLQELTFFRTDRTDKFYEYLNGGRPLFRELAEKLNIPYNQLKFYDALMLLQGKK